ncbi:MAG: Flp family type IVb pilin [Phycisphaerae bacterium]
MKTILARTKEFLRSEDGPTTVEYAVMLALIIAVAIGTIGVLGTKVNDAMQSVVTGMDAAGS